MRPNMFHVNIPITTVSPPSTYLLRYHMATAFRKRAHLDQHMGDHTPFGGCHSLVVFWVGVLIMLQGYKHKSIAFM
jgi:hypothetical protein